MIDTPTLGARWRGESQGGGGGEVETEAREAGREDGRRKGEKKNVTELIYERDLLQIVTSHFRKFIDNIFL